MSDNIPGATVAPAQGTVLVGAGGGGASGGSVTVVKVSRSKHPESAKHIEDAQKKGHPSVLTVNRKGAKMNRKNSLRGVKRIPGKDRDEYPPAMFAEGGAGASVRGVTPSDNRGAGSVIGAQCKNVPDGGKVQVVVTD